MTHHLARFPDCLLPPPYLVASAHEHSTRLAIWTHVAPRPLQRSQPSASWLTGWPSSRLAELPRLFRSH